jgi:hypothetical protein
MSGRLYETVNPAILKEALRHIKKPGDFQERTTTWMFKILSSAQATAHDIETEKAGHHAGVRPQGRRDQFNAIANDLDSIAKKLNVFAAPLTRYLEERDTPPTRPTGLTEFRRALANELNGTLSVEFIRRFRVSPIQHDPTNVSLGPINTRNRFEAIDVCGEKIAINLLEQLADSFRAAERLIANNTRSGPREWPYRQRILVNLVVLWQEIHEERGPASYGGGQTAIFKFCRDLCRSIGDGSLCGEASLQTAVNYYNEKIAEKPTPKTTQDFPVTGKDKER